MDLADLDATELVRRIQNGELTSLELIEACIKRIDAREEEIGAWAYLDRDHARRQAELCDKLRASGVPTGPLHGIPVGVKDIFDTDDYPTENGTILDRGRSPVKNCTVVNRLKAAGAVIMGKTVTTEFAVYSPGKTRNPHDPERTPGGSSSGSAAAVAAGMVPLAIGTQTNGSMIRPASFCGVVGFKPSHGRISRHGALTLSRTLDHVGVFARTIDDAALLSECLIGNDDKDPDTRPEAHPQLVNIAREQPPYDPKFAFLKTPNWDLAEPATQEAFEEISAFLGDNCDCVDMPKEFDAAVQDLRTIMHADLARHLADYERRGRDQISAVLLNMIDDGKTVTAVDYNDAIDRIGPLRAWVTELSNDYDAILTPATIGEAPVGLSATGDPIFCTIWSYLGVPAISLPLLQGENGMPLGVQLVGPYHEDGKLLRSARHLASQIAEAG